MYIIILLSSNRQFAEIISPAKRTAQPVKYQLFGGTLSSLVYCSLAWPDSCVCSPVPPRHVRLWRALYPRCATPQPRAHGASAGSVDPDRRRARFGRAPRGRVRRAGPRGPATVPVVLQEGDRMGSRKDKLGSHHRRYCCSILLLCYCASTSTSCLFDSSWIYGSVCMCRRVAKAVNSGLGLFTVYPT